MFANTLSLRFLIVGALLMTSACNQPLPAQQNGAVGAAAGAGAKGTAAKNQKTATGKNTADEAAKGQGAMKASAGASGGAKSDDMAADEGDMDSAAAGGGARPAGGTAAAAGGAAPAKNPKAVPVCEGKADEYACDERTLYHCVMGAYEGKPQSCKTAAQCTAGLTTGQCGECDPGTFLCNDVQLQRCDDTGMYVMEAECASAKLCKEEMGICDTQVCHQDEYHCEGDQLQTCNRDLSDWENSGPACEPGLCNVEAQGCLECMPGSAATCADESSIMSCSDKGMLAQTPCSGETKVCTEGKCVQCKTAADCPAAMSDCGTMTCNAGMCVAGDPKPKGTACSSNGGKMCDYLGSCVFCVTDLDCNDSSKRCYLQSRCVPKDAITATALLDTWSVTVSPGFEAEVISSMPVGGVPAGGTLTASQVIDMTYLLSLQDYSACGFIQVAPGDGSRIGLGFQLKTMSGGTTPPLGCAETVTLVAHAVKGP